MCCAVSSASQFPELPLQLLTVLTLLILDLCFNVYTFLLGASESTVSRVYVMEYRVFMQHNH